ncbi:23S rRNA (guanosine(2251)-2'-O)-methyltransferase RlmB [Candidatus Magnetaquicoccus inordinatus]|uniref:23S rRNA (guanosine(2251)-2'-O)-methyltransferase RlmB n=1 Tax=Candidatus Magnetaquicoccus inordinatus TaxID=2496818 RepID=UPI00102BA352|nr:23S rRNA (guanosine(2251)-2'-O)-methyltransferase RlmB [Candidatus Magnetaquicoccus inordinatus]
MVAPAKQEGDFERKEESSGDLVYGLNPVLALLSDPERLVETVTVLQGGHGSRLQEIVERTRQRGLRPRFADRAALDRLTQHGVHQGVVARVALRRQPSFAELLQRVAALPRVVLLLLDGVEDPRNLGAVLRSAEAFAAQALILPRDRAAPLSSVANKASAGAAERVDVVRVVNLARAIEDLQEQGVLVYGLAADGQHSIATCVFPEKVAFVLGGEGKGLRRLTRERCDQLLSIPITGGVGSLNVAVAAAIALYECRRISPHSAIIDE